MGKAKRKSHEATIEDLMAAQAHVRSEMRRPDGVIEMTPENMEALSREMAAQHHAIESRPKGLEQNDIPPNLNVFATMEAAWQDLVDRWFHEGMPDKLKQDGKFIFYHGVQAAGNLMMYCEGQDMFGAAADQVQADCIAYEREAEAVLAERKADEWRTGEI
jgi:hypothetical protein